MHSRQEINSYEEIYANEAVLGTSVTRSHEGTMNLRLYSPQCRAFRVTLYLWYCAIYALISEQEVEVLGT
ncbi:hypothetical protein AOLI_G00195520 [Acnodon oligacanthus]